MAVSSLNNFRRFRNLIIGLRRSWLTRFRKIDLAENVSLSMTARLVGAGRGTIVVEGPTLIAFKSMIRAVDTDGTVRPVRIEPNCFIGGGSLILPGVTVGHNSIVGAGAVVFDDVPPHSVVVGNPARIIISQAQVGPYGRFLDAGQKRMALRQQLR